MSCKVLYFVLQLQNYVDGLLLPVFVTSNQQSLRETGLSFNWSPYYFLVAIPDTSSKFVHKTLNKC